MHIEITQCADFVWGSMIIVDITGFKPVFLCARHILYNHVPSIIVKIPVASSCNIKVLSKLKNDELK